MRFGWMMAAVAALWALPAQAAVDLKTGAFQGTIASGTASVSFVDAPTVVLDLTGLFVTFKIDTTTDLDAPTPYGIFIGGFTIPSATNQYLRGFSLQGITLPEELVTQDTDNAIHILGAVAGSNNGTAQFDLAGAITPFYVSALTGNLKFSYHGTGSDFVTAKYDFNISNLRGLALINGAVPEPTTWALMIIGIGFAGAAMRRRQRVASRDIALSAERM